MKEMTGSIQRLWLLGLRCVLRRGRDVVFLRNESPAPDLFCGFQNLPRCLCLGERLGLTQERQSALEGAHNLCD